MVTDEKKIKTAKCQVPACPIIEITQIEYYGAEWAMSQNKEKSWDTMIPVSLQRFYISGLFYIMYLFQRQRFYISGRFYITYYSYSQIPNASQIKMFTAEIDVSKVVSLVWCDRLLCHTSSNLKPSTKCFCPWLVSHLIISCWISDHFLLDIWTEGA